MSARLAAYLQGRIGRTPRREIQERSGVSRNVVARILDGHDPAFETLVRLAWYLGDHPAVLLEKAGQHELARILRDLIPDAPGEKRSELIERVERIARRGLAEPLDHALRAIEAIWEVLRPQFEALGAASGAHAAVLVAVRGQQAPDVYFCWQCSEGEALDLAAGHAGEGWKEYRHTSNDFSLVLFLYKPSRENKRGIRESLASWTTSLLSLSR